MAFSGVTVSPPSRSRLSYGLFSVAELVDVTDPHELLGAQWTPLPCHRPELWPGECSNEGEEREKTYAEQPDIVHALPFAVYGSFHCTLPGYRVSDAQERAREHLLSGEQKAAEYAVWTGSQGNTPYLASPDAVDLGTVDCSSALFSLITEFTDTEVAGTPVVHMPRSMIPWITFHLYRDSGKLLTTQGNPVVAGAGYTEANVGPGGDPAPEGSWWVYVTGPVKIRRGPVDMVPTTGAQGFNTRTNNITALAERSFVIGWDCPVGAALFTPTCGG